MREVSSQGLMGLKNELLMFSNKNRLLGVFRAAMDCTHVHIMADPSLPQTELYIL